MDIGFILVQVIGIMAFILLAYSYYKKDTNGILFMQILSNVLFCLHYGFLAFYDKGAYSALFICLFEMIMDIGYFKTDLDNKIFVASVPFYLIGGIISYTTILDLFSIFASLTDRFCLTRKRKGVVVGGVLAYILWFIYDVHVMSISGAITDALLIVSNLFILFNFNSKNKRIRTRKVIR